MAKPKAAAAASNTLRPSGTTFLADAVAGDHSQSVGGGHAATLLSRRFTANDERGAPGVGASLGS